jgi:hypothetical protein
MVALAAPAAAQDQPQSNTVIGTPQLRDFSLEPQRRIVTQPTPAQRAPQEAPAQQPTQTQPSAQPQNGQPARPQPARPAAPVTRGPVQVAPAPRPGTPMADQAPRTDAPAPLPDAPAAPTDGAGTAIPPQATDTAPALPAPTSAPTPQPNVPAAPAGIPIWVYLLAAAVVGLAGYAFLQRRRAAQRRSLALIEPEQMPVPQPSPPRVPRPDPVPRPWIELDLIAERATADPEESIVEFELTLRNSGGSVAHNLRLQAKLICGTLEQDKEITDFHRKKPGEHRTLDIPDLPAGEEIRIKGRVDIKRADMKALRVEQRLLFIPLVAVNAFYEWNSNRSGQTSKSFLVGREKPDDADRMAPFRLDLGPRVYRSVGQRPYKIERRV